MIHDAEAITAIRIKVNSWLHNNPDEMVELMEDFSDELKHTKDFEYECGQFRCWIWDTLRDKVLAKQKCGRDYLEESSNNSWGIILPQINYNQFRRVVWGNIKTRYTH